MSVAVVGDKSDTKQEYPEPIDNQEVIRGLELALQDLEKIPADFVIPKDVHLEIRKIESPEEKANRITQVLEAAGIDSSVCHTPPSLLFLLLGWRQGVRCEKVRRLVALMKELDAAFKDQGLEMTALVEHPTNEPVDLLLRFPGKHFFLLCIRSYGDAEVVFDEKRQQFFQRKDNNKGRRNILLDPISTSMLQMIWLKKHYRPFFGGTADAANRPFARILVIWKPSRLAQHREELYQTFGSVRVLSARYEKGGSVFVLNREDVVKFVKEFLASRTKKE
jgi:hypothetical protein